MKKAKKESKCLNPNCTRQPTARGLCRSCYGVALLAIKKREATWKKLEAEGKCLPTGRMAGVRHGSTIAWIRG